MLPDVIVIKDSSDIPAHLDRGLIEKYLETHYFTELPRMDDQGAYIHIGKNPLALQYQLDDYGFKSYAFITAWNPGSELKDEWWNRMGNLGLELDLHPLCRLLRRGRGLGKGMEWPPEESFLALDLAPEKAVELARKYKQNAVVVWKKGGVPELWWVGTGRG